MAATIVRPTSVSLRSFARCSRVQQRPSKACTLSCREPIVGGHSRGCDGLHRRSNSSFLMLLPRFCVRELIEPIVGRVLVWWKSVPRGLFWVRKEHFLNVGYRSMLDIFNFYRRNNTFISWFNTRRVFKWFVLGSWGTVKNILTYINF